MPIAVAALGGNAIVSESDPAAVDLRRAPLALGRLVALGWDLVVTHGNGPQVGQRLLESQAAGNGHPTPLDVLDAETEGSLGYKLQQSLGNVLRELGVAHPVASVLTQVVVAGDDPAFAAPTKPVGPFYARQRAEELVRQRGFRMVEDAGRGFRRVVPSPEPREIVEARAIATLLEAGIVVIAAGGGGIPVVRDAAGRLSGVEAVIDKDRASSLLARLLRADMLLILTDVSEVRLDYRKPSERPVRRMTVDEARGHLRSGQFPPGSMGPKIEAAADFAEDTGRPALITSAERVLDALVGTSGTVIQP